MKHILSITVNNSSGVLSHVAGLFSRRGYNIDSLSVGETQSSDTSVITLLVNEEPNVMQQVKKQLLKLVDVIEIQDLTGEDSHKRELVLLVIGINDQNTKKELISKANDFEAKVVKTSPQAIMIEFLGEPKKVSSFLEEFGQYDVKSIARTGSIALGYPDS